MRPLGQLKQNFTFSLPELGERKIFFNDFGLMTKVATIKRFKFFEEEPRNLESWNLVWNTENSKSPKFVQMMIPVDLLFYNYTMFSCSQNRLFITVRPLPFIWSESVAWQLFRAHFKFVLTPWKKSALFFKNILCYIFFFNLWMLNYCVSIFQGVKIRTLPLPDFVHEMFIFLIGLWHYNLN